MKTEDNNKKINASICNICGKVLTGQEKLTKDHFPIKQVHPFFRMYKQSLIKRFGDNIDNRPRKIEQRGVVFERICAYCNNTVLGTNYDPAMVEFVKNVERIAKADSIIVPEMVKIKVQPIAVVKGLLGHFMAARGDTAESDYDRLWKNTILDPDFPIPDNVHVYYWYYPYPNYINVFRDVAVRVTMPDQKLAMLPCSFVSCFPVGFLVSDLPNYEGLLELTAQRNLTIEKQIVIPFRLTDNFSPLWPLTSKQGITSFMSGQSGMSSVSAEVYKLG